MSIYNEPREGKNAMRRKALIVGVCAVGFALCQGGAQAATPGFNCAKASVPDELVMCADDELASLDRQTTAAWRRLRGTDKDAATRIAREFVRGAASLWLEQWVHP